MPIPYEKALKRLARLLRTKPMTARAIALEFECSRPVAYQRLRELEKRGERLYTERTREAVTGPTSTAYGIRPT